MSSFWQFFDIQMAIFRRVSSEPPDTYFSPLWTPWHITTCKLPGLPGKAPHKVLNVGPTQLRRCHGDVKELHYCHPGSGCSLCIAHRPDWVRTEAGCQHTPRDKRLPVAELRPQAWNFMSCLSPPQPKHSLFPSHRVHKPFIWRWYPSFHSLYGHNIKWQCSGFGYIKRRLVPVMYVPLRL